MRDLAGVIRWGGLPVPYVAAWSSEQEIHIHYDAMVRASAIFRRGRRGDGKPMFGKMSESRVRYCIVNCRCQVCKRSIGLQGRVDGYVLDVPFGRLGVSPIFSEPLSCRSCFDVALSLCPGIARQRQQSRAMAIHVRRYQAISSAVGIYEGEGCDVELNRALRAWTGGQVIGYCRYAATDYDVIDLLASATACPKKRKSVASVPREGDTHE